ncbi:hypothetical protein BHM03_00009649 [Ensete ventricosum]|nr:hypothetical protein BHM03_00009649 [Ensete ventricosum]
MEANAGMVAGSHKRNEFVMIRQGGEAGVGVCRFSPLHSVMDGQDPTISLLLGSFERTGILVLLLLRSSGALCVGLSDTGDLFVACNECAFPVCRACYEYERKEGNKSCPQCKTRYKRHKGSPRVDGDDEEDDVDDLDNEYDREGEPSQLAPVDVFVSTVDPLKEPPLITANTVLSILAVDYPVDKVSCYVSDDGSAMLTFEALSETAEFARKWREYEEFKVRINALVAKAQKTPEEGWTMQDGTLWPGNNPRDHPGMIQGLLKVLAGIDTSFTVTSKSSDDDGDFAELYVFKWTSLLVPPTTVLVINMVGIVAGVSYAVNSGYQSWGPLFGRLFFAFWVIAHLYPFLKGLMGRQNRTPTIVIVWSILLASIFSLLWVHIDPFTSPTQKAAVMGQCQEAQRGIPFTGSKGDTGKSKSDRGERRSSSSQRRRGRRMSEEEGKSKGGPQQYGTFQGAPNYAQPAIGFPQPAPPPGLTPAHPFPPPQQSGPAYYARGYHAVPGTPSVRLVACEKGCFFFVNLPSSRYASMSSLFHA